MAKFPLTFEVSAKATSGIQATWKTQTDAFDPIEVAIPAEFNGPGKAYSPEDLFGMAALNCIIALFKDLCERNSINFDSIYGKVILSMDHSVATNTALFTNLDITLDVENASDKEKARELLELALKNCPVSNSIKSGKTCHLNIS